MYLRLAADGSGEWNNPRQFYGAAAEVMRRILIDHARAKRASKRGGTERPSTFDDALPIEFVSQLDDAELLDLHSALESLEKESERLRLSRPERAERIGDCCDGDGGRTEPDEPEGRTEGEEERSCGAVADSAASDDDGCCDGGCCDSGCCGTVGGGAGGASGGTVAPLVAR